MTEQLVALTFRCKIQEMNFNRKNLPCKQSRKERIISYILLHQQYFNEIVQIFRKSLLKR